MPQMQIRARILQPGGNIVHDVYAPESSPWRAACEFWLFALPGDYLFSDCGNTEDWEAFCADVAKKPTDNFAIVEEALQYYAADGMSYGALAREALAALDRLCQDYADRNAEMLKTVRDCNTQGGAVMDQMTPETLGPDDLRRLADLLERPTRYGATTARDGMRVCASAWEVASNRLEQWEAEAQDKNHPDIRPMTRLENACMDLEGKFGQAQSRIEALEKENRILRANTSKSVLRRLEDQGVIAAEEPDAATTLEQLRQPHPQQAEVDAESARILRHKECDFCHTPVLDPYHIGPWGLCDECLVILRRILARAIQEEGLRGK